MEAIDRALADLAASFDLPALPLNERSVAALHISGMGEVQLQRVENGEMVVALFRAMDESRTEALLALCSPGRGHPWPLAGGLTGSGLLGFVMRLPPEAVSQLEMERCIRYMDSLLNELDGKSGVGGKV
ncbi:MAG: hypothetical protein LUC93_14655 [Planctomycetaceae bacterium]|nr:hypothetical protein [Planctomycetaceae bacterium]